MSGRRDLLWRAARTPDAPALESERGVWTFSDLAERARRGAAYLRETVPMDDAPVALLMSGSGFALWFHAIALAGRTVVPLNYRLTAGEIARQLHDARSVIVLGETGDARLDQLRAIDAGLHAVVPPAPDWLPAPNDEGAPGPTDDDALLAVLFTSGTSGPAKGACLTWRNFAASAAGAEERLGEAVSGRWLACMPLYHVGGLSILVRSVLFGGPVRLQARFEPAAVSEALDAGDIAGVSLVPTMLSRLLAHRGARAAPAGLRVVLLGGAAAAPELIARALAAGYPLCPTYGLTEATSQVATAFPARAGAARCSPMLPLRGTQLRIVADGFDSPPGAPGEIVVRGPTVMRGYLRDPQATARALRAGWLFTGDLGLLDADGGLHVLDRREDLIVSGGENVYPAEIEAVLLEHPLVQDAGVSGVPDDDLGARVVAWLVITPGAEFDEEAVRRHCRERLAGYKQPREFRCVESLPRNAAGKLLRRSLAG